MNVQDSNDLLKVILFWHQKTFEKQKSRQALHKMPQAPILKSNSLYSAAHCMTLILSNMFRSIKSISTLVLQDQPQAYNLSYSCRALVHYLSHRFLIWPPTQTEITHSPFRASIYSAICSLSQQKLGGGRNYKSSMLCNCFVPLL